MRRAVQLEAEAIDPMAPPGRPSLQGQHAYQVPGFQLRAACRTRICRRTAGAASDWPRSAPRCYDLLVSATPCLRRIAGASPPAPALSCNPLGGDMYDWQLTQGPDEAQDTAAGQAKVTRCEIPA